MSMNEPFYGFTSTVERGEVERKFKKKNSRFILGTKNKIFIFHVFGILK